VNNNVDKLSDENKVYPLSKIPIQLWLIKPENPFRDFLHSIINR